MLKTLNRKESGPVFGTRDVVFFGYTTAFNGAMNMAIDEVLLRRSDSENRFFVRFYDVSKPTVILSNSDDYKSVIKNDDGIEICRRMTGGRPIYLDKNTIEYSITGPLRKGEALDGVFNLNTKIHKNLGPILADAIRQMIGNGHEISFGNTSSIRIDNKPIAGHAQRISYNKSFLYHGVVVIYPWNLQMIDKVLNIPEDDRKQISTLPNIHDLTKNGGTPRQYKDELMQNLLSILPKENTKEASEKLRSEVLKEAEELYRTKYGTRDWTFKEVGKSVARFCLLES